MRRPLYKPNCSEISKCGVADQSSISIWSVGKTKKEDASRLIDGNKNKELAFHTDYEKNPWWKIEFDNLYFIESINIYNRISIDVVRKRISPFVLQFSVNGNDWNTLLQTPDGFDFGAETGENVPLQWIGESLIEARAVRIIVLKDYEVLHLAAIEIFGKPKYGDGDGSWV